MTGMSDAFAFHVPVLRTARLTLRAIRAEDHGDLLALAHDPGVMRYMHEGPPPPAGDVWNRMASALGQWALRGYGMMVVEDWEGFAGRLGFFHSYGATDPLLVYAIASRAWGKGYATEGRERRWTGSWRPIACGASAATSIPATPLPFALPGSSEPYRKARPIGPVLRSTCGLTTPSRLVGTRRIDVEIDDVDAGLRLLVTGTRIPATVAKLDVARLREQQTPPLAAAGKAAAAFAGELEGQRGFFSTVLVPQDDRAELSPVAAVEADDLLALPDGLLKQPVRRARHRIDDHAALSLAAAGTGLKVSATATAASPMENEPI